MSYEKLDFIILNYYSLNFTLYTNGVIYRLLQGW